MRRFLLFALCFLPFCAQAQPGGAAATGDWYQVEVSVFSNESVVDREEEVFTAERFQPGYPEALRGLQSTLDWLLLPEMRELPQDEERFLLRSDEEQEEQEEEQVEVRSAYELRVAAAAAVGPPAPTPLVDPAELRLPDLARQPYLLLPSSASDFQQTNQALDRASDHRLLFHGIWRQPMESFESATALFIAGGRLYSTTDKQQGEQQEDSQVDSQEAQQSEQQSEQNSDLPDNLHNELEGSFKLGYNESRDRIIVAADLWLSEFTEDDDNGSEADENWYLPPRPEAIPPSPLDYIGMRHNPHRPQKVYHLKEEREMRSEEFHYLDHPALGIVIQLTPYEVPPPPE